MSILPISPYRPTQQALVLVLLVALCLAVGYVGSLVTAPAIRDWYPSLILPSWRPPNMAFPVVWTLLYILMGVSAWLVWRRRPFAATRGALALFLLQLAVNCAWSFLFFGARSPLLGLVDILPLWGLIVTMIVVFQRHDRLAAWLNLPYLLWVSFAVVLNAWIWWFNKGTI